MQRSLIHRELVTVKNLEESQKNNVEYIVFLKTLENPTIYTILTTFLYKTMVKAVVSHLAR